MSTRAMATLCFLLGCLASFYWAGSAAALAPAPYLSSQSIAAPTYFKPNDPTIDDHYEVTVTNIGGAETNGEPIVITDTLPPGFTVNKIELPLRAGTETVDSAAEACKEKASGGSVEVTCELTEALPEATEPATVWPNEQIRLIIHVNAPEAPGELQNLVQVEGSGAPPTSATFSNRADEGEAPPGLQLYKSQVLEADGSRAEQAGSHPFQYTTSFAVNTVPAKPETSAEFLPAGGDIKDIEVLLPPGLIGNPLAVSRCTYQDFNTVHGITFEGANIAQNDCPDSSAVGLIAIQQLEGRNTFTAMPLYNLVPPPGMPAQLGFQILGAPIYIDTSVRTGGDFGITAHVRNTSEAKRITAATTTIWGVPGASVHDRLRGHCYAGFSLGTCPAGLGADRPFFRLPTSCGAPLLSTMLFDSWTTPGAFAEGTATEATPQGCDSLIFAPTIAVQPSTAVADSPTGLNVNLHLPQTGNEDPEALGNPDLRDATVQLPAGLSVNPASANGLGACAPGQIGLTSPLGELPPRFNEAPSLCPDASKIGTAEALTPLLDHPVKGAVYLAQQSDNPFGSLIAIYLVLEDPRTGLVIKLAGEVHPDAKTGQLTTTFQDNPQLPVEDFNLHFFDGPRASLRTPAKCGSYETKTELLPWSAPASGPAATPSSSFSVTSGPEGGCPSGAVQPALTAGLADPTAGSYSPFSLQLSRNDATGEIAGVDVTTPRGLVANLQGIPYCPEAAIAAAQAKSKPGDGAGEASSPSCPASSQVGTVTAGAGAGPNPFYTSGGVYLAGPYKGAPLSLLAIVPAVAGPFDLGTVTDRVALQVNPETAQVSAEADPLPQVLAGIPLDLRDIRIALDRPHFTLAPTSCEPSSVNAVVTGVNGTQAIASSRFQVGGCGALRFKPKLAFTLKGGTRRGANPALTAVLTTLPNEANIGGASVRLPHSEFLEQNHIGTVCTRVQFAASACPPASIYGQATAITPLLDAPLSGPVYLRSSNHRLPDLVADLRGQLNITLVGRIDSQKGGIRTSFESVPDAPVTKFVLSMRGGKKGLLVNSRDLCKRRNRATVVFTGQNGTQVQRRPLLRNSCQSHR